MNANQTLSGSGRLITQYHVRFHLADGSRHDWQRWGESMESCLASTKRAIAREYGDMWVGDIEICGPQGASGVYSF